MGNFHRVWVRIDVNKPLKNAFSIIRDGKHQIYRVKYEKLPDWCAVFGKLGHLFKEHGNGIHPPTTLVFKDLRASWSMRTGQGPGGGRGRRGGRRGGMAARGNGNSSHEDVGSERKEDYTSKVDTDMTEADYSMKRTQMQHVPQSSHNAPVTGGQGATLVLPSPPTDPLCPCSRQDLKRAKTDAVADDL